ncbi:MAG: type III-A CRISPR-associated protein Csm2 [Promethearchaeota archaeon]
MPRTEYVIHEKVRANPNDFLNGNGKLIVEVSMDIAKKTSGRYGVTSTQIRRIFGDLKRRQYKDFNADKIQLIRPKLAYTFSRHGSKQGMDVLLGTIDFLLERVKNKEQFDNIIDFFEAILAYHKKLGGK